MVWALCRIRLPVLYARLIETRLKRFETLKVEIDHKTRKVYGLRSFYVYPHDSMR